MTRSVARPAGQGASCPRRSLVLGTVLAVISLAGVLAGAPSAAAASGSPWWHPSTRMFSSNLPVGGEATVVLTALNLGDGQARGVPRLTESFPAGYSVQNVELFALFYEQGKVNAASLHKFLEGGGEGPNLCQHSTTSARCDVDLELLKSFNKEEAVLNPYEDIEMRVTVKNETATASGAQMSGEVTGGEAPRARISQPLPVTNAAPTFGVEHFAIAPEEEGGSVGAEAGSHPFQLTSQLTLKEGPDQTRPLALTRDLGIKLPPGLVGNASTIPRCTDAELKEVGEENGGVGIASSVNKCPAGSMIGAASITFDEPNIGGVVTNSVPVFNVVPQKGEPARFAFQVVQAPIFLDTAVRTGSDYGVTVSTHNITELAAFISSTITLWGVPGDERHDISRGLPCFITGKLYTKEASPSCVHAAQGQPPAFLSLPSACGRFVSSVEGFSYPNAAAPGPGGQELVRSEYALTDEFGRELGISGCGALRFEPSIDVTPELTRPSSPSGLRVNLHMPQEADEVANGTANATIKDLSVTLPEGVTVNPASATGLEACSETAVGYQASLSNQPSSLSFTPSLPEGFEAGAGGFCPPASKIGTVSFHSRLLPPGQAISGAVYLAAQNANPFGSLLAIYVVAEDPVSGVAVKLAGDVSPDPITGRLTTTFRNAPQLPFEDATLKFFGGPRAALTTPATCGVYTTVASVTPWSESTHATPTSSFTIGAPCPTQRPFAAQLGVSPQSLQAGAFTNLLTTVGLQDGSQPLQAVTLQFPPGFSGILKGIKLCGEAQADAGTCGAESLVGHASARVGVGSEPFEVTGGQVFLTEGYRGAPFGLSIVTAAKAGPFDLGIIVVRARVEVDPYTAQITVVTDFSGPHAIPSILDGIPLSIKGVNVAIDRKDFTFNPTNCNVEQTTGAITSAEGATASVSVPFQVANCATLKFAPKFDVFTTGATSKAKGASLTVKIAYPPGSEANLQKVDLELPRALPAQLKTLQKACTEAQFNANPAGCPPHSVIGQVLVHTPVLTAPLAGPAYLVSHGGAAFPDVELVLEGEGVELIVDGKTQIKKGITYSHFETVPDAPFSSFEFTSPQGEFALFTASANLCHTALKMPTTLVGQNGAVIKQITNVAITGCGAPALRIDRHFVKGAEATIIATVPGAGHITATAPNTFKGAQSPGRAQRVTLHVRLNKKRLAFIAAHPHKRMNVKVKVLFTPKSGPKLVRFVTVSFGHVQKKHKPRPRR